MRNFARADYMLQPPSVQVEPKKKSNNGLYRWFVGRGVALGATEVDKEIRTNDLVKVNRQKLREINSAENDRITGLPNFKGFEKRVSSLLNKGSFRTCGNFGIIIISFGNQEDLSSNYSKRIQSFILNEIVYRITEYLRESDYLARTHWNEFSLIVQNVESDREVQGVQSRIQKTLDLPFWLHGKDLKLVFKVDGVIRNIK